MYAKINATRVASVVNNYSNLTLGGMTCRLAVLLHFINPQLKLDELSENAVKISDRIRRVADGAPLLRAEAITLKEEIFHIRNTKDKYTDSNKASSIKTALTKN